MVRLLGFADRRRHVLRGTARSDESGRRIDIRRSTPSSATSSSSSRAVRICPSRDRRDLRRPESPARRPSRAGRRCRKTPRRRAARTGARRSAETARYCAMSRAKMRMRNLVLDAEDAGAEQQIVAEAAACWPSALRSLDDRTSARCRRTPRSRPARRTGRCRKLRSREADFACGAIRPAKRELGGVGDRIEVADRRACRCRSSSRYRR